MAKAKLVQDTEPDVELILSNKEALLLREYLQNYMGNELESLEGERMRKSVFAALSRV